MYHDYIEKAEEIHEESTEKIQFVKRCLAMHDGVQKGFGTESTYYALDLVNFGIEHKLSEAVRLGEEHLGYRKMPHDLQNKLKNYLLTKNNNEDYWKAFNSTGPSNNTSVYLTNSTQEAESAPIFSTADPHF